MSLPTTTLSEAVAYQDTELYLASLSGVHVGTWLAIDNEIMRVTGFGAATIAKVIRAVEGTAAVQHATGTNVLIGTPSDFSVSPLSLVIVNTTTNRTASVVGQDDLPTTQPATIPIASVTY